MGTRVEFWEIPKANIKRAVIDDFAQMKNCYDSIGKEFPEDIDYDLLEELERIVNPERLFEEFDPDQIDELIALYIGDYCDYGPGKVSEIQGTSMLNIRHYIDDQNAVNRKCSVATRQLWDFILIGRSIIESTKFKVADPVFRYCFLTEAECQALFQDLVNNFDTSRVIDFNRKPGIGSVIQAIRNKKGEGILITVA